MPERVTWRLYWATPLVGALGGWLASLVGWPLPWMIGSLLAVMLVRCLADLPLAEVPGARKCGQWIVGIGIGLHFTPAVIEQVLAHSVIIVFGAVATTLSSVLAIAFMRRSGEDRATAFFASMPGGASEMVNLGQRHGAVLSRVAAAQSLRLLLVVLLVPADVPAPASSPLRLSRTSRAGALNGSSGTSLTSQTCTSAAFSLSIIPLRRCRSSASAIELSGVSSGSRRMLRVPSCESPYIYMSQRPARITPPGRCCSTNSSICWLKRRQVSFSSIPSNGGQPASEACQIGSRRLVASSRSSGLNAAEWLSPQLTSSGRSAASSAGKRQMLS
ncbi:hypothetical protein K652_07336 [Pseudomonas aeruginosa VRFPA02]|nr:hypothetical protein K652_07336 [Pseudomonas aeruginosa VRFPA02]